MSAVAVAGGVRPPTRGEAIFTEDGLELRFGGGLVAGPGGDGGGGHASSLQDGGCMVGLGAAYQLVGCFPEEVSFGAGIRLGRRSFVWSFRDLRQACLPAARLRGAGRGARAAGMI